MAQAFQFLEANTDRVITEVYINPLQDFYYETRFRVTALTGASARMGNAIVPRLAVGYTTNGDQVTFTFGSVSENHGLLTLGQWTKIRLEWTASTGRFTIWQDDIVMTANRGTTLSEGLTQFSIGKYLVGASGDMEVDYIDLNGLMYDFETLTNNHTKATDNKWHPIVSDRDNINDMQITI